MNLKNLLRFSFVPFIIFTGSIFVIVFIQNDAVQFTDLGYNLIRNSVYQSQYGVVPGWAQSPGWPILLGFFTSIFPLAYAAEIGTALVSLFLLYLFYWFVRQEFGDSIAILSVVILCLNPEFLILSRSGLSEPLYALLLFILFRQSYLLVFKEKEKTVKDALLFSVITVFLLFTRSEGVLYVFLAGLIIFSVPKREKKNNTAFFQFENLLYLIVFIVVIAGSLFQYGTWVKSKCGSLHAFPKITYNMRLMNVARVLGGAKGISTENETMYQELGWYALDPVTNDFYSANILNDRYYREVKKRLNVHKPPRNVFVLLAKKNLTNLVKVLIRSKPFPLFFLILIFLGSFFFFKGKRRELVFFVIWLVPSCYFLVSHVEERFFYVFLPYLSLISAYGLHNLARRFDRYTIIVHAAVSILFFNSVYYYGIYYETLSQKEIYYEMAKRIKGKVPGQEKICAKEFATTFYSGNDYAKMPICSVENLSRYLKKNNAAYLLLGGEVFDLRKEFLPIYHEKLDRYFKLTATFVNRDQTFKLFEVE